MPSDLMMIGIQPWCQPSICCVATSPSSFYCSSFSICFGLLCLTSSSNSDSSDLHADCSENAANVIFLSSELNRRQWEIWILLGFILDKLSPTCIFREVWLNNIFARPTIRSDNLLFIINFSSVLNPFWSSSSDLFMLCLSFEEMSVPQECVLKVFKTTLNEFKNRDKYIKDDYRFKERYSKLNPRKIIHLWAEKEMHNLKRSDSTITILVIFVCS